MKIMVITGSPRHADDCPGQEGKTVFLAKEATKDIGGVDFDFCDLGVSMDKPIIQPCKGCIGTAGGFHCHWACTCYGKKDEKRPDFMHDEDVYERLSSCDGFVVFTPIHWHSPSSVVKSFFDRLVCCNMTLTAKDAMDLFGEDGIKDPAKTREAEESGKHNSMLSNHLAGKVAAFFAQGDDGANDYKEMSGDDWKPALPGSFSYKVDEPYDRVNDPRQALMPIVWQCRYSGIYVPDHLVVGAHWNKGVEYCEANDKFKGLDSVFDAAKRMMQRLVREIKAEKS